MGHPGTRTYPVMDHLGKRTYPHQQLANVSHIYHHEHYGQRVPHLPPRALWPMCPTSTTTSTMANVSHIYHHEHYGLGFNNKTVRFNNDIKLGRHVTINDYASPA
jgi:hypothetical protein